MVKRMINVLMLALTSICINAQNVPVAAIVDNRSLDVEHTAQILATKLDNAIVTAGVHSESDRGLYLVGNLIPTGEDIVDTGMKKITIKTFNLSLKIEYPLLDIRFGSLEIPIEGSGNTSTKAAMDAIRKFNPASSAVQSFIKTSIQRADNYFVDNIDNIIDKANILARSGDYEGGIALLWGCPNLPSIHSKVYKALEALYDAMLKNKCSVLLANARSAYAVKDYEMALSLLDEINPESVCMDEAEALSVKIGHEIRQEEKELRKLEERERERQFQSVENERNRQYKLESKRISAVESIATTYLRNNKSTYHYHIW